MTKSTVIVVRHGEKNGDNLTPKGERQILAQVGNLASLGYIPDKLVYSGANRTNQCGCLALARYPGLAKPEKDEQFFFAELYQKHHGSNFDDFMNTMKQVLAAGNTIKAGLELSPYVVDARVQMQEAVLAHASGTVFAFCHSPLTSFACPDTNSPYDVGEATAVIYTVEDGEIIGAEIIPCPEVD